MTTLKDWVLSTDNTEESTSKESSLPSILLLDGGVSTHLENLIKGSFSHRRLWSSSLLLTFQGRQAIIRGHGDWLDAGSDILTTVTYQCHYEQNLLTRSSDDDENDDVVDFNHSQMDQLLKSGVELAKTAIAQRRQKSETTTTTTKTTTTPKFVVASSGCYGAAMADGSEYTGSYPDYVDHNALVEFHCQKAKTLLEQEPDGLAIETIPNIIECSAVCESLAISQSNFSSSSSSSSSSCCCWVSFSCRNGTQINDGTPLVDALKVLRDRDPNAQYIHAVGINCCDTVHIPSLLEIVTRDMAINGPRRGIVCYPNSGEEWDATLETWREGTGCTSPGDFCSRLMDAVQIIQQTWEKHTSSALSSSTTTTQDKSSSTPRLILGGCCRTSPATIVELRKAIDELGK